MKSNYIGTISGDDLNEIVFIADSVDEEGLPIPITLGEMYVAEDRMTRDRYLIRVSNVKYGAKEDWRTETAKNYNRIDSNEAFKEEHDDYEDIYADEQYDQFFYKGVCELVGYVNNKGKFMAPKRLPFPNSRVRRLNQSDMDFMEDFLGDIHFGKLRSGSDVLDVPVGIYSEMLAYHLAVFAKTGGGKSNTMQRIIGAILEASGKIGMLLCEPHGEYLAALKNHPYANDNLVIFSHHSEMKDSRIRKLRISYSDLTVSDIMNVRKQLHFTEPQERFLMEAEETLGKEWFRFVVEHYVTWDDASAAKGIAMPETVLEEQFPNTYVETMKVTQSKLKRIKNCPFLVRDNISDVDEIMALLDAGKVVLIDMSSLEGTQELLLSTALASKFLKRRKRMYVKDRENFNKLPVCSVVLEEAQRVLTKELNNDGNVFASICNEGRKFKVGLLPITQQPKNIDRNLLSQINTLFILSISDKKDFEALEEVAVKPIDKLRNEIKSLEAGEAIITSPKSPFAIPVKVDYYEDYVKSLAPKKKPPTPKTSSFRGMV